jgi:two-component system sensor histidine kinase/response regulator
VPEKMIKADATNKILVVDDNPGNIQVIGTILREAEYEIGFALHGQQALDMLLASPDYNLVLLDIKMPGMDGYEVCRIMKAHELLNEIPVIFLSASHETDNIIKAFDTGGVDYLTKPFNSKELLARVYTHMQLKQKTLEVKNYARELETVNSTKDKFFSIIAHDLRNPFEGILLLCRQLISNLPSYSADAIKKQLELIVSATEGGHELLENLLLWSRSQTGNILFKPEDLHVDTAVSKCIHLVRAQAKAKNIEINYAVPVGLTIKTDKAMFSQILHNLLSNAIKFTKSQGEIFIQVVESNAGIEISVVDNGIGISEADQKIMFRIDGNISSRRGTQNEPGSGLGLILCAEFVEKMGGAIHVDSEQGKGSKFTFILPPQL